MTKKLSKRAEALLERVRGGQFYKAYSANLPAAMRELEDANLVRRAGRIETVVSAYVPTNGYQPAITERYGEGCTWVQAETLRSAAEIMERNGGKARLVQGLQIVARQLEKKRSKRNDQA